MEDENKFAVDIHQAYYRQSQALINTFCQLKNARPFESFSELARQIQKTQTLTWLWGTIARVNGSQTYEA